MTYLMPDAALSPEAVNARNANTLPGRLGITLTELTRNGAKGFIDIQPHHMAPNGFLHAGTVISLADSLCGMACFASLPATAAGFTTVELKSNFFATATQGRIEGEAVALHLGGSTQVWDCEVRHRETDKRIALFRCTQMVLKPK